MTTERRRVLITGATGFVGAAVARRLRRDGTAIRLSVRRPMVNAEVADDDVVVIGDIHKSTDWRSALQGVSAVVHCAAHVHQLGADAKDSLPDFRKVNVGGTAALAQAAAHAGVDRFVFISSIGVHGAETAQRPFSAKDVPAPHSPYALSKWEAECELRQIASVTGMQWVVLRPPLVYGPGAPGNFATLLRAVDLSVPLPLGSIGNLRSFVAIDNLVDLITVAIRHPAAAGHALLVSDGHDVSTSDLLRRLAKALGRPSRLFPFPASWMRAACTAAGRAELGQRLFGSLRIDIEATRSILGWNPPLDMDSALVEMVQHLRRTGADDRTGEATITS